MLRARAQAPAKARLPLGSTRQERFEGEYVDSSDATHGFVRAATALSPRSMFRVRAQARPGADPQNISAPGVVVGNYIDASDVEHGFVRAKHGAITTFDVPGAGTGPGRAPFLFPTTRSMRSPDTILTRAM